MDLIKGFFSQKFDIFFANFKIKSSKMVKIISYIRLKIKFILEQTLLKNAENYTCYCSIFFISTKSWKWQGYSKKKLISTSLT